MNAIQLEDIDAVLVDLGEPMFYGSAPTKAPKRSIGLKISSSSGTRTVLSRAAQVSSTAVRQKLNALARRAPEVMVKISGSPTGMRQIRAHLDYISRNGELELEGQDGERFVGREEEAQRQPT